ncbi:MAG: hypothetical protein JOZ49_23345 [Mycolicibacterium sp.]|nr:hypothetical protein [Mycolicibacterium sp.]
MARGVRRGSSAAGGLGVSRWLAVLVGVPAAHADLRVLDPGVVPVRPQVTTFALAQWEGPGVCF